MSYQEYNHDNHRIGSSTVRDHHCPMDDYIDDCVLRNLVLGGVIWILNTVIIGYAMQKLPGR